jgi:hypothetical protein
MALIIFDCLMMMKSAVCIILADLIREILVLLFAEFFVAGLDFAVFLWALLLVKDGSKNDRKF